MANRPPWHRHIWGWLTIDSIGQHPSLKSSYFFLIAVPIVVRLLQHAPNELKMHVHGQDLTIPLALPFSWWLFYFGAICFSLATAVYSIRCPKFIKRFPTLTAYRAEEKSSFYVTGDLLTNFPEAAFIGMNRIEAESNDGLRRRIQRLSENGFYAPSMVIEGDLVPTAYRVILDHVNYLYFKSRMVATVSFLLGFLMLGIVFAQNIYFVTKYLLKQWGV